MTRRPFCYREFVAGWRELCADLRLDPADGSPRVFHWPAERVQPEGRPWWADAALFSDVGPNASTVEAEALRNVAADARARQAAPPRATVTTLEAMNLVREVMAEMRAERMVQLPLMPLRELHARRGETVEEVAGMRMVVPMKPRAVA